MGRGDLDERDALVMRVLLVTPWDQEFGGVASVVGNLATCLESRGHHVTFLHPGASRAARSTTTKWGFEGVAINLRQPFIRERPIRSIAAFLLTLPATTLRLARVMRARRIQVVNVHYPLDSFVYFALCRWLLPFELVVSIHGTDVLAPFATTPRTYSAALRLLLGSAGRIVAPSRAFLERFLSVFPHLRSRAVAIHNGLDLAEVQGAESQDGEVSDAAIGAQPFILCIASHDEWKGLDVLLRAVAHLREERSALRVMLVGDGPARPALARLAVTLGVDRCVQFAGARNRREVVRLLHACTLLVLPSRSEPFGIVVIEAMACGKPVVASAVGGITEIIDSGRTGVLVPPNDPIALAQALSGVLADDERAGAMAMAGRAEVERRFRREHMADAYERLFAELLGR